MQSRGFRHSKIYCMVSLAHWFMNCNGSGNIWQDSCPLPDMAWKQSILISKLCWPRKNFCWRKMKKRPAAWRINNTNFIISVFSSTNILFIHWTILFYWQFWCSAGLSLCKVSSSNGMMLMCTSYGSSPTCWRRMVFPALWPLCSRLLSIRGLLEVAWLAT